MTPAVRSTLDSLCRQSFFLTAAINLAANRHVQLVGTLQKMKLSQLPEDRDGLLKVQQETAKEIGGIRTTMLLDAPREIQNYHWGPLQVALSIFSAMLDFYQQAAARHPDVLRDQDLDAYCQRHAAFIAGLKQTRGSLLHERYDNTQRQTEFVMEFNGNDQNIITTLIEGADRFDAYFRELAGDKA